MAIGVGGKNPNKSKLLGPQFKKHQFRGNSAKGFRHGAPFDSRSGADSPLMPQQDLKLGKTNAQVTVDRVSDPNVNSVVVSLWELGEDTGKNVKAYLDLLPDSETVDEDSEVLLGYFPDERLWRILPNTSSESEETIKVVPHDDIPAYSVFASDVSYFESAPAKVLTKKWTNGYLMLTNGSVALTEGVVADAYVIGTNPVLIKADVTRPPAMGRTCGINPDTYELLLEGHDLYCVAKSTTTDHWWVNRMDIQTGVTQDISVPASYEKPYKRGIPVTHGTAIRFDPDGFQLKNGTVSGGLLLGGFGFAEHAETITGSTSLRANFGGISPAIVLMTDNDHDYATYTNQSTGTAGDLSRLFLTSSIWGPFRILERDNVDATVTTYPRFENAIIEFQPAMRLHSCWNLNLQAEVSSEYGLFDMTSTNADTALFTGFEDVAPLDAKHISMSNFVEDCPAPEHLVEINIAGRYYVDNATEHVVGGNSDIYYLPSNSFVTLKVIGIEADTTETTLRDMDYVPSYTALHTSPTQIEVPFTFHTKFRWYHHYEKLKIYLEDGSANVDLNVATGTITCVRLPERGCKNNAAHGPHANLPAANSATFPTDWHPGNSLDVASLDISYDDTSWPTSGEGVTLTATIANGTAPYTVVVVGGRIPNDLVLDKLTGDMTGDIAPVADSGWLNIRVVDDDGRKAETGVINWTVTV